MTHDDVVDALATARLTRLVVADTITEPLRQRAIRAAYARAGRETYFTIESQHSDPEGIVTADPMPPKLAYLVTCPWCAGMWVALGVVVIRRVAPRAWRPLARALAMSEAAGVIAQHE